MIHNLNKQTQQLLDQNECDYCDGPHLPPLIGRQSHPAKQRNKEINFI